MEECNGMIYGQQKALYLCTMAVNRGSNPVIVSGSSDTIINNNRVVVLTLTSDQK